MKIKEGFILREVCGSFLVVAVGNAVKEFKAVITLNETGAFLFKKLQTGATKEQLLEFLLSEYDVSEEIAKNDIENFIGLVQKANLLV